MELRDVPVSVRQIGGNEARIKVNVDPGSTGPQVVLMKVPLKDAAQFPVGRRVRVIVVAEDEMSDALRAALEGDAEDDNPEA